jgi:hypothetical protein
MEPDETLIPPADPDAPDAPADPAASRREFLRRSVYAAYATPLITALLVEQAAAGHYKPDDFCRKNPDHWKCR